MSEDFKYDLAISFAGEDREFAGFIAQQLAEDYSIFYDQFEQAELWGADLSAALPQRYVCSRYVLIVQSDEYVVKAWTTLERQAIIMEFLRRRGADYVLPVRVRACSMALPGLSELIGRIDVRSEEEWSKVAQLLRHKLAKQ